LLAAEESREDLGGAWCTRYRLDAEEQAGEGRTLAMRVEGRSCAHPASPDLLVDVSVSARGLAGEPDSALRAQSAQFLDSLHFTPLAPSDGVVDADDLIRRGATAEAARLLEALAERGDRRRAACSRIYEWPRRYGGRRARRMPSRGGGRRGRRCNLGAFDQVAQQRARREEPCAGSCAPPIS
jgi:hypothetical protein